MRLTAILCSQNPELDYTQENTKKGASALASVGQRSRVLSSHNKSRVSNDRAKRSSPNIVSTRTLRLVTTRATTNGHPKTLQLVAFTGGETQTEQHPLPRAGRQTRGRLTATKYHEGVHTIPTKFGAGGENCISLFKNLPSQEFPPDTLVCCVLPKILSGLA